MQIIGVDETPFTPLGQGVRGLLYYGYSILTDKYFIKNVYVGTELMHFINKGTHFMYVVGEPKPGDYLTTSIIKGAAIVIDDPKLAFAQVVEGRVPTPDKTFPTVGGCYATFL